MVQVDLLLTGFKEIIRTNPISGHTGKNIPLECQADTQVPADWLANCRPRLHPKDEEEKSSRAITMGGSCDRQGFSPVNVLLLKLDSPIVVIFVHSRLSEVGI